MQMALAGLASGFDWQSMVDQLIEVQRAPQRRMLAEKDTLQLKNNTYASLQTQLQVLQGKITALKDSSLYTSRQLSVEDPTLASGTAAAGAAVGTYTFDFTQLATTAVRHGTSDVGAAVNPSATLATIGMATAITAGYFTVNGKQVTVATTDTLQQVLTRIGTATGGTVSASYSAVDDKIVLSSAGEIVLGSATDTSNFLQTTRLYNNGTGSIASATALGGVKLTATGLNNANLRTAVTGVTGEFKINGVSIAYTTASDSLSAVMDRINASAAGVTASYDSVNDRFVLTNKTTGDVGIALEDVSGNFLAATGVSGGTLERGKDLLYTVNGGATFHSRTNTLDGASAGLTGLSVTALAQGSTTITVAADTAKVKTAINDFLTEYNAVQNLLYENSKSETDDAGKVTAGVLSADATASEMASKLRGLASGDVTGLSGTLQRLHALGIATNGDDDTLALDDEAALDAALGNQMADVQALFTHATTGVASRFDTYLTATVGEEGTLLTSQATLTDQMADIDTQVSDLEAWLETQRQQMIDKFVQMELAQQRINQQLQYLTKQLGSTSTK